jgi:hypothetical protein
MSKLDALKIVPGLLIAGFVWAQSDELPPAPIQPKVATACSECHGARIIVQQRLSKPAWTKEVDKMIRWGALVDPADHDAFVDYLRANFPADKSAYVATKTAPQKSK